VGIVNLLTGQDVRAATASNQAVYHWCGLSDDHIGSKPLLIFPE
jgi:hypothetical protein